MNPHLKLCFTCQHEVARAARACPHCGAELKSNAVIVIAVVVGAALLMAAVGGAIVVFTAINYGL